MSDVNRLIIALPTFTQNIRRLKKKYRSVVSDLKPTIDQLECGETPGDQIPGISYAVFEVRVRNSDAQRVLKAIVDEYDKSIPSDPE